MSIGPDTINIQLFLNQSRAINLFNDKDKMFIIMSWAWEKGKNLSAFLNMTSQIPGRALYLLSYGEPHGALGH